MAALGLWCCVRAFFNCDEQGLCLIAVCQLPIVVALLILEYRLQASRLQGLRHMDSQFWHTALVAPRHQGSSPTRDQTHTPALAGGFLTTEQPGKPIFCLRFLNSLLKQGIEVSIILYFHSIKSVFISHILMVCSQVHICLWSLQMD